MAKNKNILFLSFFFEPDLSAGSFRNTNLFKVLKNELPRGSHIHVITTMPNRYGSYNISTSPKENGEGFTIDRIQLQSKKKGYLGQMKSFYTYYKEVIRLSKDVNYDLVYASSSRLFTAFLGSQVAIQKNIPLYLDIRDIFVDTMNDVFGNKLILKPLLKLFKLVERTTFKRATHINLVSKGFESYFRKYNQCSYSFFTNGIDELFLDVPISSNSKLNNKICITYAGNIGSGQGLEKVIPTLAKQLGDGYVIKIIGDGNTKALLEKEIRDKDLTNVVLIPPVDRLTLINYYCKSDYLFLHLNDLKAFEKVLPSKLFEYGAFDKPILAGVSGYAAKFIREELVNSIVFEPTKTEDLINQLYSYDYSLSNRLDFKKKYARINILKKMSESILTLLK